jgi:hypothetical protein
MKQGNAIYVEIPNNLVAEKSPQIQVNKVYEIKHFKILPTKSLYRPVEASFMIQFTVYTQAQVVTNPTTRFPTYIYKLTSFSQLPSVAGKTEDFVGTHKKISLLFTAYICVHRFFFSAYTFKYIYIYIYVYLTNSNVLCVDVLGMITNVQPLKQASATNRSLIRDITIKDSR